MKYLYTVLFALLLVSCDKFLDIQPTGKVIAKTSDEYRALLTAVYKNFPDDRSLTALRTDEMTLDPSITTTEDLNSYFDIWTWNDVAKDANTSSFNWRTFYHTIYIANYVIEHQSEITEGTPKEIKQMVGEAYMLRAYCHFIMVNLYGEPYTYCSPEFSLAIPLAIKADVEAVLSRSSVGDIYKQIVSDIESAKQNLNVDKWDSELTYRFNITSADALLSRVALYMGNWQTARDAAQKVIAEYPELEDLTAKDYILPDNYKSKEAIVCLEQVMKSSYKGIGTPNLDFINSYRTGDLRKSRYFKAQTSRIYSLLKGGDTQCRSTFRNAEAYLTAAEAAARLGDTKGAISILTPLIKTRYMATLQQAIISEREAMSQGELIEAILKERAHELCFEGHRWFDLRRTTRPSITKTYNNIEYTLQQGDSRYTMPIPTEAINANPNLATE